MRCSQTAANSSRRFSTEATRAMLEDAQIARIKSGMSLKDAELRALRGRVDPQFLLSVMQDIERRYESTPNEADRLVRC